MDITKLWEKNADFVLSICKYYIKDPAIAEDIRQEVFLKIINSKKSFNKESNIKTWLYTITYRCCVDYFREERRQKEIFEECSITKNFYVRDVDFSLWKVNNLSCMPCPISQLMVELHYVEGWSKQEIAKIFGYSMAQIYKRIQTGLCDLQNFLD